MVDEHMISDLIKVRTQVGARPPPVGEMLEQLPEHISYDPIRFRRVVA